MCEWNSSTWYTNYHTEITRFHAHHIFGVDHVIRWNETWKRGSLIIMKGMWRDWMTLSWLQKALYLTTLLEWLEDSWLSSIRFPPLKTVEGATPNAFLAWALDHHLDTHMPAMDMLLRAAMMQTPVAEPPLVKWCPQWNLKIECRQQKKAPISIDNSVGSSTLKEKLTCRGPMALFTYVCKGSGIEAIDVVQWWGQQLSLCPMASAVAAEPHPVEPKLQVDPKEEQQS